MWKTGSALENVRFMEEQVEITLKNAIPNFPLAFEPFLLRLHNTQQVH